MDPRDFEYFARIAREAEKHRLHPEVEEGLRRQAEFAQGPLNDPGIRDMLENRARLAAERRDWARHMPDAATQKAISEAARFFDSDYFRSQSAAVAQSLGLARARLGPEGLASAGRVAGRRAAESPSADEAAERIEAGEAEALLEEAAELAASPEVRGLIERADVESLVRLDEQQAEAEVQGGEPREHASEGDRLAELWARRPTKKELGKLLDGALMVLVPIEAALGSAAMLNPSSEIAVELAVAYLVLTAIVSTARMLVAVTEDEDE